ncbi:signal recognition particle protein [Clostridium sp. CAG:492]|jgi:signal recognition particle subunit SRP54|nr:signal recognition particle protein [Clostridium sp. CAG:492]
MAFEGLSSKFQNIARKFKGKTRITESDLKEMLREVKLALLEADVNYKIVKEFIATIQEKALGQDVLKSLTPGQQVIKIVKDELVELLGGTDARINISPNPPTIIMMVGLQGSGKTTTAAKLANILRKDGKKPLLVACDVYRPAAIKQLQVLGAQLNIPVYANENSQDVVKISKQAIEQAISKLNDVIIIDTAGRLQIDEVLMEELKNLKSAVKPHEILLVVDSMTGQEAVNVAESFKDAVGIDGIVLTKLDGDTRGGAALSVKKVTGRPIKYIATGEKMNDIEQFHPDRMASRILGMGDVLSIIEKAEEAITEEEAEKLEAQLRKNKFDLDDYLTQLRQIKKMGSFSSILKMIPGLGSKMKDIQVDDKEFLRIESMICSMTKEERRNPKILNGQRRLRIAKGSGTTVEQLNKFMKSFEMTQKMMKQMKSEKGMKNVMRNLKGIDKDAFKDLKF